MTVMTTASRAARAFRREGLDGVAQRISRKVSERFGGNIDPIYLLPGDIVDSHTLAAPPRGPVKAPGEKLDIGWVMSVPGPASGGHTTIFRFVQALEAAGHRCVLYIYDGQDGDASLYEHIVRQWWPGVRAEVRAVKDGMRGMDAYIATAWATAHVLAKHSDLPGRRFYLVQDYEPWFYPRGTAYELAEDTYRFGFQTITIGHMLARELEHRYGHASTVAEFGCDTGAYRIDNRERRDGVVFYAKPGVARRGYELGVMALRRLAEIRPDARIHTFGIRARALPFPAEVHGHMPTEQLNTLYNECGAGLALSFSNISLIPYELLAAGVVPVVNDFDGLRDNLDNPHVVWSRSTPDALAEAMTTALDRQREVGPDRLRESVAGLSWTPAQDAVVDVIERECTR